MAVMTIRNIDEVIKKRLWIRAAEHGRSMEDEARDILRSVLASIDAPIQVTRSTSGLAGLTAWIWQLHPVRQFAKWISERDRSGYQCVVRCDESRTGTERTGLDVGSGYGQFVQDYDYSGRNPKRANRLACRSALQAANRGCPGHVSRRLCRLSVTLR